MPIIETGRPCRRVAEQAARLRRSFEPPPHRHDHAVGLLRPADMLDVHDGIGDRGQDRDDQRADVPHADRDPAAARMRDRAGRVDLVQPIEPAPVPDIVEEMCRMILFGGLAGQIEPPAAIAGRTCAASAIRVSVSESAALGEPARDLVAIEPELANHRAIVAHQPFGVDLVVEADAVRDRTG